MPISRMNEKNGSKRQRAENRAKRRPLVVLAKPGDREQEGLAVIMSGAAEAGREARRRAAENGARRARRAAHHPFPKPQHSESTTSRQAEFRKRFASSLGRLARELWMCGPKGTVGGYPLEATRRRRRSLAREMARQQNLPVDATVIA